MTKQKRILIFPCCDNMIEMLYYRQHMDIQPTNIIMCLLLNNCFICSHTLPPNYAPFNISLEISLFSSHHPSTYARLVTIHFASPHLVHPTPLTMATQSNCHSPAQDIVDCFSLFLATCRKIGEIFVCALFFSDID